MKSSMHMGKRVSAVSLTLFLTVGLTGVAFAEGNGLNGIGSQPTTQTQQTQTTQQASTTTQQTPTTTQTTTTTQESGADVVGGLMKGVGVDGEASQRASTMMAPLAKSVNFLFATIMLFATLGMFLITALDLLYIAVPPVRGFLYQGGQQAQAGGGMGMGGMGMGGFGGGYGGGHFGGMSGGMSGGMGGGGQQQQPNFLTRFISDEAVAAVSGMQGQQQQGGGMGMGMMGGGMQQQQPPKVKSVIFDYLKKRVFFLLMFGLCAVLLSTTIFTDLGVKAGSWILTRLLGMKQNFPQ